MKNEERSVNVRAVNVRQLESMKFRRFSVKDFVSHLFKQLLLLLKFFIDLLLSLLLSKSRILGNRENA